jgi:hypothetical protein
MGRETVRRLKVHVKYVPQHVHASANSSTGTTGVAKHCRGVLGALQQLANAGAHAPYLDRS